MWIRISYQNKFYSSLAQKHTTDTRTLVITSYFLRAADRTADTQIDQMDSVSVKINTLPYFIVGTDIKSDAVSTTD